MSTYLQILIYSIFIPFIFSFHPKIRFYKNWKPFFIANLFISIPFLIWDNIFTIKKVWSFGDHHLSGIKIGELPIEEIMFFIFIPYCFMFTYEVFKKLIPKSESWEYIANKFTLIFGFFVLALGVFTLDYMYTSTTCIILSLILILIGYVRKEKFLIHFYITFLIITCIPFLIVNGMLTGILEDSINTATVTYNDNERFFNRFLTIPIEDFFYSLLLLISNTWMYEVIKKKFKKTKV